VEGSTNPNHLPQDSAQQKLVQKILRNSTREQTFRQVGELKFPLEKFNNRSSKSHNLICTRYKIFPSAQHSYSTGAVKPLAKFH
jgi:hypothetical protein